MVVENLTDDMVGHEVTVIGTLLCDDYVCWLVPQGRPREITELIYGVRVILAGLGAGVRESNLADIGSGRPDTILEEAEITGTLADRGEHTARFRLLDVSSVILRAGGREKHLDLKSLTEVSAMMLKDVGMYENPDHRRLVLDKHIDIRSRA